MQLKHYSEENLQLQHAYFLKGSHVNNFTFKLNKLKSTLQQTKPKTSKRKEIIKIRDKINEMENKNKK